MRLGHGIWRENNHGNGDEASSVNALPGLSVRILGPGSASRNGLPVAMPRSRKVRALLAFLTLEKNPVSRSRLCDLLWDVPNDPRGELRWCLSKLRSVLDDSDRPRVVGSGDTVALDLSDCDVDALEIERLAKSDFARATDDELNQLNQRFGGDLLEGTTLDGSPEFLAWLTAQRQRFRTMQVAVLSELSARAPRDSDEIFIHLQRWLRVAAFDQSAHAVMLDALLKRGRVREADQHVASTIRSFEREGLDWSSVREAWRTIRNQPVDTAPARALILPAASTVAQPTQSEPRRRRASIAVMPFRDESSQAVGGRAIADGMTDDVIGRLARLRVLFVIARGTIYALGERGIDAQEAGRILNVDYVASGTLRSRDGRLSVMLELVETHGARIIWTDQIDRALSDTFEVLDSIVNRIVAAIAEEVEAAECNRALLKPPNSLDAWEAYHRGLWHMYKFNGADNAHAARFFRVALELDPRFSRAHSGLSFTHFQNAFLNLTSDRDREVELALDSASQSLAADERDPAAHWALGRALWLNGNDGACIELERSIELSPNFALGYYTLGFVHSQSGDPHAAIVATDYSRQLSPFDPLQFGMLASRALSHVRLGQFAEAADFAVRAAGRPNAHTHILAIAAQCLVLADRPDEARKFVTRVRKRSPSYTSADFLAAFRFDRETERVFRRGARQSSFTPSRTFESA